MAGQFLLGILLLLSGTYIYKLCEEREIFKKRLTRYDSIISQEDYQQELYDKVASQHNQVVYLEEQYETFSRKVNEIKKELGTFEEELELQSFGFYEPKYNFLISSDYAIQLKSIKSQQKQLIISGHAFICPTSLIIFNSQQDGKKFIKGFQKLILNVFNESCDEVISKTKPGKIDQSRSTIERKLLSINKISRIIQCEITQKYLQLKFHELDLTYEMELVKQEEREIAKQTQADKRDRDRLKKAEAEVMEIEERETSFQRKIYEMQQKIESEQKDKIAWSEAEKEEMRLEIENLKYSLKDIQNQHAVAEARAKKYKSGHIFIISNIGSFGRDVYKIHSTTCSDEDNPISVMNRAVPFPFDIHMKFFSEDVRDTLGKLRECFQDRRVNKINFRRDFFRASFDEIKQAVDSIRKDTGILNFTVENKVPEAYEYRRTQQQQEKQLSEKKVA